MNAEDRAERAAIVAGEQVLVDKAFGLYDTKYSDLNSKAYVAADASASRKDAAEVRMDRQDFAEYMYSIEPAELVKHRVETEKGEIFLIGLRSVFDENHDVLVVNWKADEGIRWLAANQLSPEDLTLRRSLGVTKRRVTSFRDDIVIAPRHGGDTDWTVEGSASGAAEQLAVTDELPVLDELLREVLDRARDGSLQEIVGTIQRDQLALVSEAPDKVMIIQGGPGTGKTSVGIHRISVLIFRRHFDTSDVVIIGPHRDFLDYVAAVLPILGTDPVETMVMTQAWGPATGTDTVEAARVKADARMAEVLHRAVESLVQPMALEPLAQGSRVRLEVGEVIVFVDPSDIAALATRASADSGSYDARRRKFLADLLDLAVDGCPEFLPEAGDSSAQEDTKKRLKGEFRERVRDDERFRRLAGRVWPRLESEQVLRLLLSNADLLQSAAEGILSDEEQAVLAQPERSDSGHRHWTVADKVLLDELDYLFRSYVPRIHRHIVIDEAQDLTPMQARTLARRAVNGSMTVLGDLAQATGPYRYADWSELAGILSAERSSTLSELKVGYRVPSDVMRFVRPLARAVAPSVLFPHAIRPGVSPELTIYPTQAQRFDELVAKLVTQLITNGADDARKAAVIAPQDWHARASIPTGARLLTVEDCRGLEFDHVIVVEPAAIVEQAGGEERGLSALYVALTRCTQSLTIVHSLPLPAQLSQR